MDKRKAAKLILFLMLFTTLFGALLPYQQFFHIEITHASIPQTGNITITIPFSYGFYLKQWNGSQFIVLGYSGTVSVEANASVNAIMYQGSFVTQGQFYYNNTLYVVNRGQYLYQATAVSTVSSGTTTTSTTSSSTTTSSSSSTTSTSTTTTSTTTSSSGTTTTSTTTPTSSSASSSIVLMLGLQPQWYSIFKYGSQLYVINSSSSQQYIYIPAGAFPLFAVYGSTAQVMNHIPLTLYFKNGSMYTLNVNVNQTILQAIQSKGISLSQLITPSTVSPSFSFNYQSPSPVVVVQPFLPNYYALFIYGDYQYWINQMQTLGIPLYAYLLFGLLKYFTPPNQLVDSVKITVLLTNGSTLPVVVKVNETIWDAIHSEYPGITQNDLVFEGMVYLNQNSSSTNTKIPTYTIGNGGNTTFQFGQSTQACVIPIQLYNNYLYAFNFNGSTYVYESLGLANRTYTIYMSPNATLINVAQVWNDSIMIPVTLFLPSPYGHIYVYIDGQQYNLSDGTYAIPLDTIFYAPYAGPLNPPQILIFDGNYFMIRNGTLASFIAPPSTLPIVVQNQIINISVGETISAALKQANINISCKQGYITGSMVIYYPILNNFFSSLNGPSLTEGCVFNIPSPPSAWWNIPGWFGFAASIFSSAFGFVFCALIHIVDSIAAVFSAAINYLSYTAPLFVLAFAFLIAIILIYNPLALPIFLTNLVDIMSRIIHILYNVILAIIRAIAMLIQAIKPV